MFKIAIKLNLLGAMLGPFVRPPEPAFHAGVIFFEQLLTNFRAWSASTVEAPRARAVKAMVVNFIIWKRKRGTWGSSSVG